MKKKSKLTSKLMALLLAMSIFSFGSITVMAQPAGWSETDEYEDEDIGAPDDGGMDYFENYLEETDFWKLTNYPLMGIIDLRQNLNQFLQERGYFCQEIHFIIPSAKIDGGIMTYDVRIGETNDLVHVKLYMYDVVHEFVLDQNAFVAAQ